MHPERASSRIRSGVDISTTHLLVVTDDLKPQPAVLAAIRQRADNGPVSVHVLFATPDEIEWHPMHPDRQTKGEEALWVLGDTVAVIENDAGVEARGSVGAQFDPLDAVEDVLTETAFDEVLVAVAEPALRRRLVSDITHRLAHFRVPAVGIDGATPA